MSSGGGGEVNDNINNTNEQPMAVIEYTDPSTITINADQPRQPTNLQDLLRFSVEASGHSIVSNHGPFLPMDEERKKFLEDTLKHLTVDVVEMLLKAVDVLKRAGSLELQDDPTECEQALEQITDYVDNLDTANDFHKVGGFCIFRPCLDSAHGSLRWRAAQLVAELTQNNPYCQEHVLKAGLLPVLLALVDTDPSQQVRIKALYAISCLVRDHEAAVKEFSLHEGYSVLLRALQSRVEKLQIKSAFLLASLCSLNPNIKDELCQMGFVEQLVALIAEDHRPVQEHLLSALVVLVKGHALAQAECRRPELAVRPMLSQLLKKVQGKEEFQEVNEYCQELISIVFTGDLEEER